MAIERRYVGLFKKDLTMIGHNPNEPDLELPTLAKMEAVHKGR